MGACFEQPQRQFFERRLGGHQCGAQGERRHRRLGCRGDQGPVVARAKRLGGEAGGAHAQEAQHPIQGVHDGRADGHGAQVAGIGQLPHDRGVHRAHQGNGQIGQDHWPGQRPDAAVPMSGRGGQAGGCRIHGPDWRSTTGSNRLLGANDIWSFSCIARFQSRASCPRSGQSRAGSSERGQLALDWSQPRPRSEGNLPSIGAPEEGVRAWR